MSTHRGAFTPNREDEDGLSVYRERLVTPEQVKANARKPPEEYIVVRLLAKSLYDLGLTIVLSPDDPLPGHCVIPELSLGEYKRNKRVLKPVQVALMGLAERCNCG